MRRTLPVPPAAQAAVPLRYGSLLLIAYAVQYLALQLIWNGSGELSPLFLAICPRNVVGFFGP